jgi:hypothetical protein
MKEINCNKVFVPWYIPVVIHYSDMNVHLGLLPIVKAIFWNVWFAVPNWLVEYQSKDCIQYIPDYFDPIKGAAMGIKVSPFLGFVMVLKEGTYWNYKWWKHLKKYERN